MPPLAPPDPATLDDLTDAEQEALDAMKRGAAKDSGYSTMHRTRPQTIGYALADSPAGLAAWITEKLPSWSDPRSELSLDTMLDNLMIYWLPRTARVERPAVLGEPERGHPLARRTTRTTRPRRRANRVHRFPIRTSTPVEALGRAALPQHPLLERTRPRRPLPALEQPALFVDELTNFFALVR